MTESYSYKLQKEFGQMRNDPAHRIGLDIRISRDQQEDIVTAIRKLEVKLWQAEGALQEVHTLLQQSEGVRPRVVAALEGLRS